MITVLTQTHSTYNASEHSAICGQFQQFCSKNDGNIARWNKTQYKPGTANYVPPKSKNGTVKTT